MPTRGPEGEINPLERAVNRFERQASSKKYNPRALQRALDSIRDTGMSLGSSPGELFANLAALSEIAVDLAAKQGSEEDQQAFAEQKQVYTQASEQLSQGGEIVLPTAPSQPQRTTGRAAG